MLLQRSGSTILRYAFLIILGWCSTVIAPPLQSFQDALEADKEEYMGSLNRYNQLKCIISRVNYYNNVKYEFVFFPVCLTVKTDHYHWCLMNFIGMN